MASIKNLHLYKRTKAEIDALKAEHDWRGSNMSRVIPPSKDNNHMWELVVYALPPKKRKPKRGEEEQTGNRGPRRGNGFNRYKEMGE